MRLLIHFIALAVGLAAAFALNRFLTPGVGWARWLAVAWSILFVFHALLVAAVKLATLGFHNPT